MLQSSRSLMKLLHCLECHDVVGLQIGVARFCFCGKCAGVYRDRIRAEYSGPAQILTLDTPSLLSAAVGKRYVWVVLPDDHPMISKVPMLSVG